MTNKFKRLIINYISLQKLERNTAFRWRNFYAMKGKKAKLIIYMITAAVMLQIFSSAAVAYDVSQIKGAVETSGAQLPEYSDGYVEITVQEDKSEEGGETNWAGVIQDALDYARDNASDTLQVKVVVPAGEYRISRTLRIYSNTWLYLEDGAVIKKCFDSGCMLKNTKQFGGGGYDADRNIIIEGGTWDGNTSEYNGMEYFSNIRIGHARNIVFKNTAVVNNKNGHHLELGGIEGLTIEGCTFSGYSGSQLKEAIQLDVMNNSELFIEYEPFDDTATNNVVIKDCEFTDLCRAIGSHSAVLGKYYTNTLIQNNTFENIRDVCIIMYNHKNCTIEDNVMTDVGMGIDFMYMSEDGSTNYFEPTDGGYEAGESNINDDARTLITGNVIKTVITSTASQPYAIRIYGKKVEGTKLPDHDYRVRGVKISGNEIISAAEAIILDDAVDCVISENTVSKSDGNCVKGANLIDIVRSKKTTVLSNSVSGSSGDGIRISGGKIFEVSDNTVSNSTGSGICLINSVSESEISGNTVKKSEQCGIIVKNSCESITIDGNSVVSAKASGISISDKTVDGISCKDNSVSQSARGICITAQSKADVSGSTFSENDRNVAVGEGSYCTLSAPSGVAASEITENTAVVSWAAQSEADGYEVYRKSGSKGEYELVSDLVDASFSDSGLTVRTLYFYKIVPYVLEGENKQYGNAAEDFEVKTKTSLENAEIAMQSEMAYTGNARTQNITVTVDGITLRPKLDYKVEYSNNINIGTATLKIVALGEYCGEVTREFGIIPMAQDSTKVKASTAKPSAAVSKRSSDISYSVVCKTNDYISLADSDELKTPIQISLDSFTVRQTYLIGVRSYSVVDGTRIYGVWSGLK